MSRGPIFQRPGVSDEAYVELVRSLYGTLLPAVVMSGLFVGVALLAYRATGDGTLLALGIVGLLASVLRLGVALLGRRQVERRIGDRAAARTHERRFGGAYVAFAVIIGLFAARALLLPNVGLHMVVAALLVGYAAGVAAGVSLRPRIGGTSMLAAVMPPALVCLASMQIFHVALGIVLLALLAGGLQSMRARYRSEVEKIEMRREISGLARRDHLTGLPNRLGLHEAFERATAAHALDCLVAVHCLDLDRFKPVNDQFGHLVGDELLRMVAGRLAGSLRHGDIAVRTGGDEFVVLQCGLRHADEAELLARRLNRAIAEPYAILGHSLSVGVSVGYVVSSCDEPLRHLLERADHALYEAKGLGGNGAARDPLPSAAALVSA